MRGGTCSLGAIHDLVQQPCSRIPHLQLHILSQRARPSNRQIKTLLKPNKQKWFHACSKQRDWRPSFQRTVQAVSQSSVKPDEINEVSNSTIPQSNSELLTILEEGHPDRVLHALLHPDLGSKFIRRADDASFAAAFTAIDPRYFIEPFKNLYRFLKPSLSNDPTYRWVRPIGARFGSFASQIDSIVVARKDAGHKLTLDIYRHLLACAREMGNGPMANFIFKTLMPVDQVKPDLDCYNYFMEATCWSNAFSKEEQWRLRVTPRILAIRGRHKRPLDLIGHRVARIGRRGDEETLRLHMIIQFKKMVAQGLEGDENTFTNLMIAMGRENDLAGARSILKSVYNIDVDLLLQLDEEEMESPTFYDRESPLRPSARLLFTVAHLFSSNNDLELAFKLVDYISRYYDLEITREVWMHLFEWAFVLHIYRSGSHQRQGQNLGQIPFEVFINLWNIMTDEPHNVIPDAAMLSIRARAFHKTLRLDETVKEVLAARALLEKQRQLLYAGIDEVVQMAEYFRDHTFEEKILPASYFDLRRKYLLECLEVDRDLQLLTVAVRAIFKEKRWPGSRKETEWERRRLPALVEEFSEYLPNVLTYQTNGGIVEIEGKSFRNALIREEWKDQARISGTVRAALDTDDHERLVHGLRDLPRVLQDAADWCFVCESKGHRPEDCTVAKDRANAFGQDSEEGVIIRRAGTDTSMTRRKMEYTATVSSTNTLEGLSGYSDKPFGEGGVVVRRVNADAGMTRSTTEAASTASSAVAPDDFGENSIQRSPGPSEESAALSSTGLDELIEHSNKTSSGKPHKRR